jgi:hypothetical protein
MPTHLPSRDAKRSRFLRGGRLSRSWLIGRC